VRLRALHCGGIGLKCCEMAVQVGELGARREAGASQHGQERPLGACDRAATSLRHWTRSMEPLLNKHKRSFDGSGVWIAPLLEEAHRQNHLASQVRCARQGRGENLAPRRFLLSVARFSALTRQSAARTAGRNEVTGMPRRPRCCAESGTRLVDRLRHR